MRNEYWLWTVAALCALWMLIDWLRGVFWARNWARKYARPYRSHRWCCLECGEHVYQCDNDDDPLWHYRCLNPACAKHDQVLSAAEVAG